MQKKYTLLFGISVIICGIVISTVFLGKNPWEREVTQNPGATTSTGGVLASEQKVSSTAYYLSLMQPYVRDFEEFLKQNEKEKAALALEKIYLYTESMKEVSVNPLEEEQILYFQKRLQSAKDALEKNDQKRLTQDLQKIKLLKVLQFQRQSEDIRMSEAKK